MLARTLSLRGMRLPGGIAVLLFLGITAFLAPIGYHLMFSGWAPYDDEGYMLISLKSFISGGQLYDHVYSQYGPFVFEAWGGLYSIFGIAVTHDAGRFTTLAVWLAATLLTGLVAWRISGSVLIGLIAELLAFRILLVFKAEPLAPGGLACLLIVAAIAVVAFLHSSRPRSAMFSLGLIVAALGFTKANIGVFALLAAVLACFAFYPALANKRWRLAVEGAFVLAPIAVVGGHFSESWARELGVHVALAALAVVIALRSFAPATGRDSREVVWLGGGVGLGAVLICLAAIATGTSVGGLIDGVVTGPLKLPDFYSQPYTLPGWSIPLDLVMVGLAIAFLRSARANPTRRSQGIFWPLLSIASGLFLAFTASALFFPARGEAIAIYELSAIAVCWLALANRPGRPAFGALFLAPLAAIEAMQVYPVAGSQVRFAASLLLLPAAVSVADGLRGLGASRINLRWAPRARAMVLAAGIAAAVLVANLVVVKGGRDARVAFDAGVSIGLPGASRVRVSPDEAYLYQGIAHTLKTKCDTFVSLPGMNSFYLWTGQSPPTQENAGDWMFLFDTALQRRVVEAARSHRRLCSFRNPALAQTWRAGQALPDRPLLRFIRGGFGPDERFQAFLVAHRQASPAHYPAGG